MKRLITVILAISMLCSLTACGTAASDNNTAAPAASEISSNDFDAVLEEYASLLIDVGVNIQDGDTLVIRCPVDQAAFGRLCASAAYDAGAAEVVMYWRDNATTRERYLKADDSVLDTVPEYQKELSNGYALKGASLLSISSRDPNLYEGVDSKRIARVAAAEAEAFADFYNLEINMEFPWCIAAVPNEKWATKVFAGMDEEQAVAALWDAILKSVYVSGDGTAAKTWQEHIDSLKANTDRLNSFKFRYLHYTNSLGTDLTVELMPSSVWVAGQMGTPNGKLFVPNLPTEEAFTAPIKNGTNGVVYSSMPLCLNGTIIENIKFVIENGKIVSATADTGEDVLLDALDLDENARYLGEISLVPYDSPISNMGILFYDTLFDENASCHIAFGAGYSECIEGGQKMSADELAAAGVNDSAQHEDFMIGTKDLKIVGTTFDGEEVVIFENGNYAADFLQH